MSGHALLSPSSAHRWLNCPLAPRLEDQLPAKDSDFAKEGTVAHSVCEISAKKYFKKVKAAEYNKVIKKLKTDPNWNDEMLHTAEIYTEHLSELSMGFEHEPYIAFEVSVDISDYVPEAFGQCDCVMLGGNTLIITDYKHGKGVPVKAENNPQLMLYALGALKAYKPIYGDAIKQIEIRIDQPRIGSYEVWSLGIDALLAWGEEIKPKAQAAFIGLGGYHSGDWCRFCRANGICKAQAEQQFNAFDDFSNVINNPTATLSPSEIGAILERGKNLVEWFKTIQDKASELLLSGEKIPGWKLVEGRSSRVWSNQDQALQKLMDSGVEKAIIYDSVPKSLAQLEKMLGTSKFNELVGEYVIKPQGKPTLASESDARKEFNSAAADFAGASTDKEDK